MNRRKVLMIEHLEVLSSDISDRYRPMAWLRYTEPLMNPNNSAVICRITTARMSWTACCSLEFLIRLG